MATYIGTQSTNNWYLGSSLSQNIYFGSTKVWSSVPSNLRTINISFGDLNTVIPNWNKWWPPDASTITFLDDQGVSTGIKMLNLNSEITMGNDSGVLEGADPGIPIDPVIPNAVLDMNQYLDNPGQTKLLKFTGLDNSKKYDFAIYTFPRTGDVASVRGYHKMDGVTKILPSASHTVHKLEFLQISPVSGEIAYEFGDDLGDKYPLISAMIIKTTE